MSLFLDLSEVLCADETLGVDFAHIFSTGRTRREPTFISDDLQAADRCAIAGSLGEFASNLRACERISFEVFGSQFAERGFLFGRGGRIFTRIVENAVLVGKFFVMFGRILAGLSGNFNGEQVHNDTVFIGRPNACIFAQERRAGRLFAAEAH